MHSHFPLNVEPEPGSNDNIYMRESFYSTRTLLTIVPKSAIASDFMRSPFMHHVLGVLLIVFAEKMNFSGIVPVPFMLVQ